MKTSYLCIIAFVFLCSVNLNFTTAQEISIEKLEAKAKSVDRNANLPDVTPNVQTPDDVLKELINIAISNHPTVQQAMANVNKIKGERFQATRYLNPTLMYQANEIGNAGSAGQHGIAISQTYIRGNKLGLNDQVKGWEEQVIRAEYQTQLYKIAGGIRLQYYEWLAAQQKAESLRTLVQFSEKAVNSAQKLQKVGEIPERQLMQVQILLQQNKLALNNADIFSDGARKRLLNIANLPLYPLPIFTSGLSGKLPQIHTQSMWEEILGKSPEITKARNKSLTAQWNVQRQKVEPIPDLQTQLGVQYDDGSDDTFVSISLGGKIPVFNKNRGNIYAANSEYISACKEIETVELSLRQRFVSSMQAYQAAVQRVEVYEDEILPLTLKNVRTTINAFQAGEANYLELLTAQQSYIDTLLSLVDARKEVWKEYANMKSLLLVEKLGAR